MRRQGDPRRWEIKARRAEARWARRGVKKSGGKDTRGADEPEARKHRARVRFLATL